MSTKNMTPGTSLVVQQLKHLTFNTGDMGLIPDWGTKLPHAAQCGQKFKKQTKNITLFMGTFFGRALGLHGGEICSTQAFMVVVVEYVRGIMTQARAPMKPHVQGKDHRFSLVTNLVKNTKGNSIRISIKEHIRRWFQSPIYLGGSWSNFSILPTSKSAGSF